jgi:penicillin amidase
MVKHTSLEMLAQLGSGVSITVVAAAAGLSREQFDAWWQEECRRRVPVTEGVLRVQATQGHVEIRRNRWGMPHVSADNDADLFFGFGHVTAQDRLFQLDHWRRKARGRLAEVLGPPALESDLLYRTLGLALAAETEWASMPAETRELLAAYSTGINAWIEESDDRLPIEFDLLGYRPEPWAPQDCIAIAKELCWYLTGRFPVLIIPELARLVLGDGLLYREFLLGEADEESILPAGSYAARSTVDPRVGAVIGGDGGPGSNNWVVAGGRTATGRPLLANDPHLPYGAVSLWHQVQLCGGSFHVAGAAMPGIPAVMSGRSERVAWGFTNNICSLRDLYQEKTNPAYPGCFLYDGHWGPAEQREEIIGIRGAAEERRIIYSSRNGPIVDDVLPSPARKMGPLALRWLGTEPCGWLTALIGMNRARTSAEFREATRPWRAPTFNLLFADVDGHIGLQSVGRIPVRRLAERGYRPGWDPRHQWDGFIPFDGMPRLLDPPQGFLVTANNRLAPDDYPYPLSGTWSSGLRARRIRTLIEERPRITRGDCQRFQQDVYSGRAAACVTHLTAYLCEDADPEVQRAVALLKAWDARADNDSVAATLFQVFFRYWCRLVAAEHFPPDQVDFVSANVTGLAARLLAGDRVGWFSRRNVAGAVAEAFQATRQELSARLGPEITTWTWGRLHTLKQPHFLSSRGDLGQLLDRSGLPLDGDGSTVNNGTTDGTHASYMGPGFRMVADLADPACGLWMIEVGSASGHPGSAHYDDQLALWAEGSYWYVSLDGRSAVPQVGEETSPLVTLIPEDS